MLTITAIVGVAVSRAGDSSPSTVNTGTTDGTSPEVSENDTSSNGNVGSGDSTDPIEQARDVLASKWGSSATYDQVKAITDSALRATGNTPTDDLRSRAWSAVLVVSDDNAIDPMTVMSCVSANGAQASMTFPDLAALCAVSGG